MFTEGKSWNYFDTMGAVKVSKSGGSIFNVRKIRVSCDSFDAAAEIVTMI